MGVQQELHNSIYFIGEEGRKNENLMNDFIEEFKIVHY